jgi:hypothetical protein
MTLSNFICALIAALAIIVTALGSYETDRTTDTLVKGCDPFGYSRMADAIRTARASGASPDFFIHDDQTRWLIAKFKENHLPVSDWSEAVTTHAHHYFPGTDQVGPQYPPGTGWVMSLFPKDGAVMDLDQLSIILLVVGGILILVWCATNGLPMSCLMVAGAVTAFLSPYQWIFSSSYSINATIFPLFLGILLAWFAAKSRRQLTSAIFALGSGILFGLLIQTRIASVLFLPAILLIFLPGKIRLVFWYLIGVVLNGILPVLLHNKTITGNFFGMTYSKSDSRQELGCIYKNSLHYYSHFSDSAGYYVLGLFLGLLLFVTVIFVTSRKGNSGWKSWMKSHYGLVASPFVAFVITIAYFLTHYVTTPYYLVPGMLGVCLLLALLFVAIETHWCKTVGNSTLGRSVRHLGAIPTALIAMVVMTIFRPSLVETLDGIFKIPSQSVATLDVPPELLKPNAWIWADNYSSSVVYYTAHPAFKMTFASPELRKRVFGWIKDKGDTQYLVIDCDSMHTVMSEAQAFGAKLTPVGYIREAPCYKLDMP